MNRFAEVNKTTFKDTETDINYMVWNNQTKSFVDMADDVASGLNLIYSMKLRRGASANLSEQEFESLHSAFLAMERSEPHNILIRDIVKLCNLIASHRQTIKFNS